MVSNHNRIKLEITKSQKIHNIWKVSNVILNL